MAKFGNIEDTLAAWLEGSISDEDFLSEVGKSEYDHYQQILHEVDTWTPTEEGFIPEVDKSISRPKKDAKVRSLNARNFYRIAASVALILVSAVVVYFMTRDAETIILAESGVVREVQLPDGKSVLFLSGGSQVSWNESDWSEESRSLKLEGKAYLEVVKGHPFVVNTVNGQVAVLGTRFEVHDFEEGMSVTCFEGRVQAITRADSVIISGGESFLFEKDQWKVSGFPESGEPIWIQGVSTFKNAPLIQVIRAVEREYELTIDHKNINTARVFTGSFPNNNLEVALRLVFEPLSIKYKKEGEKVILSE